MIRRDGSLGVLLTGARGEDQKERAASTPAKDRKAAL